MMFYNIHNMVGVLVEDGVSSLIIKEIDSQIGYFRQDDISETLYQVVVRPFSELADIEYISQELFLCKSGREYLVYNSMKLGVEKTENGYCVYAEEPNVPLVHLIHYLLLRCGCTIIHSGGAIDTDGKGILIPGMSGVGKTSLLIHLVRNRGYHLVGDDNVILNKEGMCYSFPKESVGIKSYLANEHPELFKNIKPTVYKEFVTKIKEFIAQNAPFRGVVKKLFFKEGMVGNIVRSFSIVPGHHVPMYKIYGADNIIDSGKVQYIIYLQRHTGSVSLVPMTEESMCKRIIASTHNEWTASMGILYGLSTIEKEDIIGYFGDVESVIRSGIKGKDCWLLMIPDRATTGDIYKKLRDTGLVEGR